MVLYIISSLLSWCTQGLIIQRIVCTEICLWVVPQYGVMLQTMLSILASVLSTSDPMQHFSLLGLFMPTLGMHVQ